MVIYLPTFINTDEQLWQIAQLQIDRQSFESS